MEDMNKWEEIISSKFDEPKFSFDEANWEKAEAMLDKRLRREKFRRAFFIYFTGLMSGLLLMFFGMRYFSSDNSSLTKQPLLASNESHRNAGQPDSNDVSSSFSGHTTDEDGDNQKSKANTNDATTPNMVSSADNADQPAGKTSVSSDDHANASGQSNNSTNPNTASDNSSVNHSHHHNAAQPSSDANSSSGSNSQTYPNTHVAADSNDQHGTVTVVHGLTSNDVSSITGTTITYIQPSTDVNISTAPPTVNDISTQTPAVISAVTSATTQTSDTAHKDVDPAFAAMVDSMYAKKSGFSLEAGTNFNLGWSYGDSASEGRGFNPVAGIAYTAHFGPDWTLRTSIRYENYRHFRVSKLETVDAKPGFGKNNIDSVLIPHSLHYINIPLMFERRIGPRSFIGIGATYSYLFTTRSRTERWNESNEVGLEEITPGTAYGYMHGFNSWDAELDLAYQHQLTSHFGMRLEGSYGLREFKDNTLYKTPENKMDRVFALRFMLTYNFGKQ